MLAAMMTKHEAEGLCVVMAKEYELRALEWYFENGVEYGKEK